MISRRKPLYPGRQPEKVMKQMNGTVHMKENEDGVLKSFPSVLQVDVPTGRDGKHKQIVERLLENIARLKDGSALKVPLADLPDSKENIRSALSRATKQQGIEIATSSDQEHLYIWKPNAE
jgi:TusA-related sulfurtransferase